MLKKTIRLALIPMLVAAALASLHAWQAGGGVRPPRQVVVNDATTGNPLIDMGGTFYTLESKAVRVRTRFANGTAIVERAPDGDIRARMTDQYGNARRQLTVDLTGASSSTLDFRDADGGVQERAVTRAEVRPTLDWAALQLHAVESDGPGPREWRGRFLRSKASRDANLDDEALEVETEFETGLRSTTTRIVDKKLGVIYRTTVYDGGTEVGWMAWRQQAKTLAFEFKGISAGAISEKSLARYGGWRFQPTLSWANVQGFAYYDFGVKLRLSGKLGQQQPPAAPAMPAVALPSPVATLSSPTAALSGPAAPAASGRAGASNRPKPLSLLRRFEDLFVTSAYANDEGCDGFHWLDGSMFRYCCDMHDACYEKRGCSSSSWRWPFSNWGCTKCNLQAIWCFSTIEYEDLDSLTCELIHWQFNVWLPGCPQGN